MDQIETNQNPDELYTAGAEYMNVVLKRCEILTIQFNMLIQLLVNIWTAYILGTGKLCIRLSVLVLLGIEVMENRSLFTLTVAGTSLAFWFVYFTVIIPGEDPDDNMVSEVEAAHHEHEDIADHNHEHGD